MSQALKWILPIAAFLVVVALAQAQFRLAEGERDALHEQGIAEGFRRQRAITEPLLAAEMERFAEQAVVVRTLTDSVDKAVRGAVRERRRASALAATLVSHVEAVAGDSVAIILLVDSITVAHADEVHALETRLSVTMTLNAALFRRIEQGDTIIEQHVAANELLRMEITAWERTSAAWSRAARPGFFLRLKQDVGMVAGGVAVGAVACLAFCR